MSALPPKADIRTQPRDVRFVPKADSCSAAICDLLEQVLTNFCQQVARAVRLRHVVITSRCSRYTSSPASACEVMAMTAIDRNAGLALSSTGIELHSIVSADSECLCLLCSPLLRFWVGVAVGSLLPNLRAIP